MSTYVDTINTFDYLQYSYLLIKTKNILSNNIYTHLDTYLCDAYLCIICYIKIIFLHILIEYQAVSRKVINKFYYA
jgi:hypothetical protein